VIPTLGRLISGDGDAYRYLPDSTQLFQQPENLADLMRRLGFANVHYKLFMFGTVAIHVGEKARNA
jgi:demethylmenaquinone methyltransferase / 2-methoxy-6-polyprenyl-1,4-benzoquinol methylase